MSIFDFDKEIAQRYGAPICGVDEAGRGPLAGPVFAAAVILPQGFFAEGLNDSKKLSAKKRDALYDIILQNALSYAICSVDEKRIDEINILNATMEAMSEAVSRLAMKPSVTLIDGNKVPSGLLNAMCVIGGDAKSASIAAASILAKVSRDSFMEKLSADYPQYQFSVHKGYGTRLHYECLRQYGISPVHRRTFLKSLEKKE